MSSARIKCGCSPRGSPVCHALNLDGGCFASTKSFVARHPTIIVIRCTRAFPRNRVTAREFARNANKIQFPNSQRSAQLTCSQQDMSRQPEHTRAAPCRNPYRSSTFLSRVTSTFRQSRRGTPCTSAPPLRARPHAPPARKIPGLARESRTIAPTYEKIVLRPAHSTEEWPSG
jgi:hypothetical protein